MLNPDLEPWNLFNSLNNPQLGVSGNVIIDSCEWYNSFMPCYFDLDDLDCIIGVKREIEKEKSNPENIVKSNIYKDYMNLCHAYSGRECFSQIVLSLKQRVNRYFNLVESSLLMKEENVRNEIDLFGFVLAGLNLMQEYMDPIETLTTLKCSQIFPPFSNPFDEVDKLKVFDKTPSSEVAYIPMAVLISKNVKSESLDKVFRYYLDLFEINEGSLIESVEYANKLYNYAKYMKTSVAQKLIDNTSNKIDNLDSLDLGEMVTYKMQEINGIMTWSKNVLSVGSEKWRRYDSTNNILGNVLKTDFVCNRVDLKNLLIPKTISGSEKQGMLIYLLRNIKCSDMDFYERIKIRAKDYYLDAKP